MFYGRGYHVIASRKARLAVAIMDRAWGALTLTLVERIERRLVHVVDDDEHVRRSTAMMLGSQGFDVQTWSDGASFVHAAPSLCPACILLDLSMPGLDGLDVQRNLQQRAIDWPVIFLSGTAGIPDAVAAVQRGAIQFLVKPVRPAALREALAQGFRQLADIVRREGERSGARIKLQRLSPREHDVLDGLVSGAPNKTIAYDLGVSPRTIEAHRASIMRKLEAPSFAHVMRIAIEGRADRL